MLLSAIHREEIQPRNVIDAIRWAFNAPRIRESDSDGHQPLMAFRFLLWQSNHLEAFPTMALVTLNHRTTATS